ncbi:hypothetical protein [Streptomyces sp. Inha503]|uniref:hypothetical protein n=1 Tax=Streptomyces sp. Inha503 TaxID=3383314 RepID=UPI0039A1CED2
MAEDWRPRHAALLEALTASGELPEAWRPAFDAVPRHHFIPGEIWEQRATCVPMTTDAAWWDLVYRDAPIVTQVDDGLRGRPGDRDLVQLHTHDGGAHAHRAGGRRRAAGVGGRHRQ